MTYRITGLVALSAAAALAAGCGGASKPPAAAAGAPPVEITVAAAEQQNVNHVLRVTGTLTAAEEAEVAAETAGRVTGTLTPVYTAGAHINEAVSLHHLTPIRKVGDQIAEQVMAHRAVTKEEARDIAISMLRRVGIPKPDQRVDSYTHQLSGGQRQRVMIAVALSCEPAMLIADEPTTALDVSIEAQILDIMRELQESSNMAIMFITHNLGVIASMAEEIVVMYMGKVVEQGKVLEIFQNAKTSIYKGIAPIHSAAWQKEEGWRTPGFHRRCHPERNGAPHNAPGEPPSDRRYQRPDEHRSPTAARRREHARN